MARAGGEAAASTSCRESHKEGGRPGRSSPARPCWQIPLDMQIPQHPPPYCARHAHAHAMPPQAQAQKVLSIFFGRYRRAIVRAPPRRSPSSPLAPLLGEYWGGGRQDRTPPPSRDGIPQIKPKLSLSVDAGCYQPRCSAVARLCVRVCVRAALGGLLLCTSSSGLCTTLQLARTHGPQFASST